MMNKIRFLTLPVVVLVFIMTFSAICLAEESYTTSFDEITGTYTINGTGTAPRPVADSTIKKLVVEEGITVLSGSGPSAGCTNCTVVELPDSLTDITAPWCFYGWSGLTDITIPKNVKTITDNTFYDCTSLKTAAIEGAVETIPASMFVNCSKLETVWFAEGVKNIGRTVFYKCASLKDVYFPSTVESINSTAFLQANSVVTIHGTKGSYVESWCAEKGYTFSAVTPEITPTISLICEDSVDSENSFDVYVSATENSNICGGRITIGYDNTVLEIVSVSSESLLNGVSVLTNLAYTEASSRISLAGVKNITSGGNLLKLTFKAKTIYEDANASVYIQEMKFTDSDGNAISFAQQNTSIAVKAKKVPELSVECADEVLIGSNIDVKINISENSLACGGRFDLVYDNTRLQIVSAEAGSVLQGMSAFVNPNKAENKIRLSWAGTSGLVEKGTVLNVKFKALGVPGEALFSFENYKMVDENDNHIECLASENRASIVTELICSTSTVYAEEAGQWKFTSTIKNCPEKAVLIVALYNGKQLLEVKKADLENDAEMSVYLPKRTFDKAKVFVWNSLETIDPISGTEEIFYK